MFVIFFVFLDMKVVVEDDATLMKMMEGFASGPKERTIRMRERIRRWWKIVCVKSQVCYCIDECMRI